MIHAEGLDFLILHKDRYHPLKKRNVPTRILFYVAIFFFLAQPTNSLFFCLHKIATYRAERLHKQLPHIKMPGDRVPLQKGVLSHKGTAPATHTSPVVSYCVF